MTRKEKMIEAIKQLPDNATNGDIIEALFGNDDVLWRYKEDEGQPLLKNTYSKTWWNAPYKN